MFRESEKEDYLLTDVEEKRMSLYFLYLYHVNYENEPRENKKIIREYYDRELRYRGAFYRDRKTFKDKGSPLEWEKVKVQRYKTKDKELIYYRGMNIYQEFVYPSETLIEIELSKRIELPLINREKGKITLNWMYENEIRDELDNMKSIIEKLDSKSDTVIVKKGFKSSELYTLSDLQITYKVNNNDYIRYISTAFMIPAFVIDKAMNLITNYLANVTRLGDLGETFTGEYIEYDEDFEVETSILERIYIKKRTDVYDRIVERKQLRDYDLEVRNLGSIRIKGMEAQ